MTARHILLLALAEAIALGAMGALAAGAWINATSFDVVLRMSSRRTATRLQPQVELRPADQPFTGQPTATGAAVSYRCAPVLGKVHLTGLHDGLAYHWRVRVHDTQGFN